MPSFLSMLQGFWCTSSQRPIMCWNLISYIHSLRSYSYHSKGLWTRSTMNHSHCLHILACHNNDCNCIPKSCRMFSWLLIRGGGGTGPGREGQFFFEPKIYHRRNLIKCLNICARRVADACLRNGVLEKNWTCMAGQRWPGLIKTPVVQTTCRRCSASSLFWFARWEGNFDTTCSEVPPPPSIGTKVVRADCLAGSFRQSLEPSKFDKTKPEGGCKSCTQALIIRAAM